MSIYTDDTLETLDESMLFMPFAPSSAWHHEEEDFVPLHHRIPTPEMLEPFEHMFRKEVAVSPNEQATPFGFSFEADTMPFHESDVAELLTRLSTPDTIAPCQNFQRLRLFVGALASLSQAAL